MTSRKPSKLKTKDKAEDKAKKAYEDRLRHAPKIPDHFSNPLAGLYKPVGIPNKNKIIYDPNFHAIDYVQHCREGNTHTYILACWGISPQKFVEWKNKYPKFAEAAKEGRTCFQAFWHHRFAKSLTSQEKNDRINTLGFIWFSKNTMSWGEQPNDEFQDSTPDDDFSFEFENTGETFDYMMQPSKKNSDAV